MADKGSVVNVADWVARDIEPQARAALANVNDIWRTAYHKGIDDTLAQEWLVWSNEHRAWWRSHHNGYTPNKDEAGRYSIAEAAEICESANRGNADKPHETMLPV